MTKKIDETKEERAKRLNRERQLRHRIRRGDPSVMRGRDQDKNVTTIVVGDKIIHHKKEAKTKAQEWRPRPTITLHKKSTIEDMREWCMDVAEELRQCSVPAAWASALNSILKLIENLDKKMPQKLPEVKERPRATIIIEDDEAEEE